MNLQRDAFIKIDQNDQIITIFTCDAKPIAGYLIVYHQKYDVGEIDDYLEFVTREEMKNKLLELTYLQS